MSFTLGSSQAYFRNIRLAFFVSYLKFHSRINSILRSYQKSQKNMLSTKFQVNDIVDAVDELFIWWKAKIISIKDDWTVIVQWEDFGKKTASEIHVEENIRGQPEKWNIRKYAAIRDVFPEKRRRTKKRTT